MHSKLTSEQEASLPLYRDKWIKIGLDTSPIDRPRAIEAVKLAYVLAEQPIPKYFLFADGPREAMLFLSVAPHVTLTEDDFERLSNKDIMALTDEIRKFVNQHNIKEEKPKLIWPATYGQHAAGYLSFYDFFDDAFGLAKKSKGLREIGKECGWVWMYANLAIITSKPIRVTLNTRGQLHNERMPAVEYADGTKVYAFNGVVLPEKWILQRDTIDPKEILSCTDTDKRAAGIALFGYSRLKSALNYRIIEGDPNTDIGALVEISIPGLPRKGRFLEAICPRNGPVFLGVPDKNPWDNNRPILDAVGAQAFLARLPRSAYEHPAIRT
jgi:hypothetical protein